MALLLPARAIATMRAAPFAIAIALAVSAVVMGGATAVVALAIFGAISLWWIARLQQRLRQVSDRIVSLGQSDRPATPDESLALIEQQLHSLRHRSIDVHPVSGLPVREGLVERMAGDRRGVFGVIAFTDFDRLAAFDPMLANLVFATCSARLRSMMSPDRFLAQVDRGHIGIWFGASASEDEARAELDASAYALGEAVLDGDTQIIPQIAYRLAVHDADEDGLTAAAFVARTLASLATPPARAASPALPEPAPGRSARDQFSLEQDLRLAIDRRELHLQYQPLVDASQRRVCGAEALLRWEHPVHGPIPPSQFVPVLEAMGLAQEIGMWVLNSALREVRGWASAGLPGLRVAVNVSSLQLEYDDLPRIVQRTLAAHGVGASQLELELTESVATGDADDCRAIFRDLRAMGVKLAVDDFGTGYSGFSSLRTLAFDKIKIDREFVIDVDTRSDSQAICQSIIALGRGLGIRVLAEGIERRGEYEWLQRHGCHHFQGYYFGRPMSGEAFTRFVRDRATIDGLLGSHGHRHRIAERLSA
jgi:EAL domain-containing protein (putative c-di-GMP-specific phosphodiesterase class I)